VRDFLAAFVIERNLGSRDGIGDGEGGIPAVADVRGVVQPSPMSAA
jgi:hypothetical protein